MRVKIGPYLTWWGPFQVADLLKKVGVSEDRCYSIGEWLSDTWVGDFCQWIYDKRSRTVKVHIDKYDCWSADSTIAFVVAPLLRAFVAQGIQGIPQLNAEEYGPYAAMIEEIGGATIGSDSPKKYTDEEVSFSWYVREQVWRAVLDSMIYSMEQINGGFDMVIYEQYKDTAPDWQQRWIEHAKLEEARIQQGLDYFGKYFRAIWN